MFSLKDKKLAEEIISKIKKLDVKTSEQEQKKSFKNML